MSLSKINYIKGKTALSAENLNDIQDNIIINSNAINKLNNQLTEIKTLLDSVNNKISFSETELNSVKNALEEFSFLKTTQENLNMQNEELFQSINNISNELSSFAKVTISQTPPENPKEGDIWFNPDDDSIINVSDQINNNDNSLITGKGVSDALSNKLGLTKIWQNASPTSFFPNQTIKCKDLKYDLYLIVFYHNIDEQQAILKFGLKDISTYSASGNNYRIWTATNEGIIFEKCSYENVLIPYQIYGVKEGNII